MHVHDDHFFHGSALLQIAEHPLFTAINRLTTTVGSARSTFRVNDDIGIYLKYASKPNGKYKEYQFTFTKAHLHEVDEIASKLAKTFVALICVQARHICCLTVEELRTLVGYRKAAKKTDEPNYTIIATLPPKKQFRAYVNSPGGKGKMAGRELVIPRNTFPNVLFE